MNTIEAIKSRRSIRKYKRDIPVPREHIQQFLEAAMMAPSACNTRPWEFVVVESREVKERIMQAMRGCKFFCVYGGKILPVRFRYVQRAVELWD